MSRMKAPAILHAALDTLVQRGVKRDQPDGERSMPRIVRVYEAITGHPFVADTSGATPLDRIRANLAPYFTN